MFQSKPKLSLPTWFVNPLRIKRRSFIHSLNRLWFWVEPVKFPGIFLLVLSITLVILGFNYAFWTDMSKGIFIEAVGAAMDILIFGILLAFASFLGEKRREIRRQQDVIDDFKKWNSDEARYRIAGAVRRLIRLNRTSINFSGIELCDFSFPGHDIKNIAGSIFYDGTWGTLGSQDKVHLERVDFMNTDCRNVIFSKFNPFSGFNFGDYIR